MFLKPGVHLNLKFIDDVYDLSRGSNQWSGAYAVRDNIFSRRGVDHGAMIEISPNSARLPLGYRVIEDSNPVEL